ncbi:MAG: methylmalonyl Co-A mutase-associated GTPase MeaB [Firmicutes bacterium]|nr:methylmalonyl Co-A mutase-associated GTPase MeaB [Bacillota bacterium]
MSLAVDQWVEQIRAGDVRALSRAITAIENGEPEAEVILQQIFPHTGRAYRIGVTGAPGTGKSSLVDRLAAHYRRQGQPVGILAVDPTSPFTGGAILGDRIRMQGHASDPGTFIRSMATRGFLGGLARATTDAALVLDAAGKQVILIETVGVGQDEVEIARLADCTLVVLVPGLGDDIQNMKAGLMEIGDIFVLNKSDREGADRLEQQLRAMLELAPTRNSWRPAVVRTVATEDRGIAELAEAIARYRQHVEQTGRSRAMAIEHWKQRLLDLLQSRLLDRLVRNHLSAQTLTSLAEQVAERKKDPYTAVEEILAQAGLR